MLDTICQVNDNTSGAAKSKNIPSSYNSNDGLWDYSYLSSYVKEKAAIGRSYPDTGNKEGCGKDMTGAYNYMCIYIW